MAAHEKHIDRAERKAQRALSELGRELRLARLNHDLSQTIAAASMGRSHATWSRIERGAMAGLSVTDLARALSVVGLDLHVRAYPGGDALRDVAHVRLLARLRECLGSDVGWATEVPLPNAGDRRSWDALVRMARLRIGIEAETRGHDSQELKRRVLGKARDGGVDQVILLLADTRHNRAFLREAGTDFQADFPIDGRSALRALSTARDPGGNAVILL